MMMRRERWKIAFALFLLGALGVVSKAQEFQTLASFDGANGASPVYGSLVQGSDGSLYGTAAEGGDVTCNPPYGCGTVFKISPQGELTVLHVFEAADGPYPEAGLILATDGNFYGTSIGGYTIACNVSALRSCGTVFRITPSGTLTTLHRFDFSDGAEPISALVEAAGGDLYGTTSYGGDPECFFPYGCGTVFTISFSGKFTILHKFEYGEGSYNTSTLIQATDGSFYGTKYQGGAHIDFGTVFKINRGGVLTVLHSFDYTDGERPLGGLVQGNDGKFYGTTSEGGTGWPDCADGCGTVFDMASTGELSTLHDFCPNPQNGCPDGTFPVAGLVQATDGNLYGTTSGGGTDGSGTIFSMPLAGSLTTLYTFCGHCPNGSSPNAIFQATDGNFYGTTASGGANNDGTVFKFSMGLGPFVTFVRPAGKVGQTVGILGQGFNGTTSVMLNGVPANYTVVSDTFIKATVPSGASTGYVTVTTPTGVLTSNVPFHVIQ